MDIILGEGPVYWCHELPGEAIRTSKIKEVK